MNKEEDTSDLEFLAAMGFGAEGAKTSELDVLKSKWAKRRRTRSLRNNVLIGLVSVTLITVLLWYNQKTEQMPSKSQIAVSQSKPVTLAIENLGKTFLDSNAVANELFVRPIAKAAPVQASSKAEEHVKVENLTTVQAAQLPIYELKEEKLKFMINSPIFYIHDLKVSNYQLLYFRKNKFVAASGHPANIALDQTSAALSDQPDRFLHETLAEALLNYKKGFYSPCVALFNEVASFNTEDINCDFYRGMSWYQMKHYDKAISYFTKCEEALNNAFLQEAQYYKALSYKASGQEEKARNLFQKIVNEGEFYAEKAKGQL
jgi:tetratricopeptide (TPR) repeat protein